MEIPVIAGDQEAHMIQDGYVSADSHVVEPGDLWVTRMDKGFRDNAPRVEPRPDGDYYIIKGNRRFPRSLGRGVDGGQNPGRDQEGLRPPPGGYQTRRLGPNCAPRRHG